MWRARSKSSGAPLLFCTCRDAPALQVSRAMNSRFPFTPGLKSEFADNLAAFEHREIRDDSLRKAAVAIVVALRSDGDGACIVLTRRPAGMRRHAGQYALPGGRLDEGETFEAAALRELSEELGLSYAPHTVIGTLDDYRTRSGFVIRPFVLWGGVLDGVRPDPEEVDTVFQIPLEELEAPEIPRLRPGETPESPIIGLPLPTLGHDLHAPTAAMIYQFREVAMYGRDTRVAHFDQPAFAWK